MIRVVVITAAAMVLWSVPGLQVSPAAAKPVTMLSDTASDLSAARKKASKKNPARKQAAKQRPRPAGSGGGGAPAEASPRGY